MNRSARARLPGTRRAYLAAVFVIAAATAAALAAPASGAPKPVPTRAALGARTSASYAQFSAGRSGAVRYAVIRPACAAPTPSRYRYRYRCMALQRVNVPKGTRGAKAYVRAATAAGPAGGFTPADLASAYGFNAQSSVGASQTIAIVDWNNDPHALVDLNLFDAQYGLPAETPTSFQVVNQDGASSPLPADTADTVEITLDIESARAVCNLCKIVLVEGDDPTGTSLATAENTAARLGATEISNSYGGPEDPTNPDPPSVVAAYNHPGIVITASTGDNGWYDWDGINFAASSSNAPSTPASYPSVVSVAGTAMTLNADGTRGSEAVWNENGIDDGGQNFGASGGGCSTMYPAPPSQLAASGYVATGCAGKKMVGDVAALADPYTGFDVFDSTNGGWLTVGGTSLASPIVAALWALAGGSGGVSYPAQSLYANYRYLPSSLRDVVTGGNGFCDDPSTAHCAAAVRAGTGGGTGNPNNLADTNGNWLGLLDCSFPYDGSEPARTVALDPECNAARGYDGASGVGTPSGLRAFQPPTPRLTIASPSFVKLNSAGTFRSSLLDPVASASRYSWSYGDGSVRTSTATHTYRRAGTFTVSLSVTDSLGRTASAATRVTVGRPLYLRMNGSTTEHRAHSYRWTSYGSTDPNTGGRFVRWYWSWGDGTSSSGASVVHHYASLGRHTLTLFITDNAGVGSYRRLSVNVVR